MFTATIQKFVERAYNYHFTYSSSISVLFTHNSMQIVRWKEGPIKANRLRQRCAVSESIKSLKPITINFSRS